MSRIRDAAAASIILVISFLIFWRSPVHHMADSRYQMLFSQQLLRNHRFGIEPKTFPECRWDVPEQLWQRGRDFPYHLERFNGRFYYWYPAGSTVLSVPYLAVANAFGISVIDRNGLYDEHADERLQALLAAMLMAGLTVVVFFTARLFLSRWWSAVVSATVGFAMPVWSIASRTMWNHTWGIFLLSLIIYYLARQQAKQVRLNRPVLLASALAWLYFIRPTFSGAIIAVAIYVFAWHRQIFLRFAITGAIWLAAFIGYSWYQFGHLLPLYYQSGGAKFVGISLEALGGNLISPSRGLLVYVPIVLFIVYLLVRYRAVHPRLVLLGSAAVIVHFIILSALVPWHAGHSYGPRYSTDLVPWFALLAILGIEARQNWQVVHREQESNLRMSVELGCAIVLLAISGTLSGLGALSYNVWWWNVRPNDINTHTERLWDWKHPQFLAPPPDSRKPT